eukprot:scaffold6401_cov73-Isochrysis_galbana.AAC.2
MPHAGPPRTALGERPDPPTYPLRPPTERALTSQTLLSASQSPTPPRTLPRAHLPNARESEPVHFLVQRAQVFPESLGHHVDPPVDQVDGRGARGRLAVDGGAGLDEVADVGDVHTHL